ncbi:MAG: tetratricopeptide repeat protein [Planctomycetes bacterium]|nr:tetratricopeptide repeat protein [Planctomycetota bacterium]
MSGEFVSADRSRLFAARPGMMGLLAGLVIVAAAVGAYSGSMGGPFIFDDADAIQQNLVIRKLWPSLPSLLWHGGSTVEGRPVVTLTLAINYAVFSENVWGYHAVNLLIHALAGLLLFGIIRRTLLLPGMNGRFSAPAAWLIALFAGLIWTVHPLCTSAVTYIVQRCESLMGMFYLLTLYCVIRASASSWPASRGAWGVLGVLACMIGMGCKEVMATAPVVVLAYDRIFLAGSFRELFRRRWPLYAGLAASWGALVLVLLPSGMHGGAGSYGRGTTTPEYALTQFGVIAHYIRLAFWPSPLCLDYNWPTAAGFWQIGPQAAIVLGLLGLTIFGLFKFPKWAFCGVWFFCILSVTSSFIKLSENIFEHRMYLPLAAIVSLVVIGGYAGISKLANRPALPRWTTTASLSAWIVLCLFFAAMLAAAAWRRNTDYRSELSIWQDTINKRPNNYRAWTNLSLIIKEHGDDKEAIAAADRAISLKSDFPGSYVARGVILQEIGRADDALADFESALKIEPKNYKALLGRGTILVNRGQYAAALEDLSQAIAIRPTVSAAYTNRAKAYCNLGQYKAAIADFATAFNMGDDSYQARILRAACFIRVNEPGKALADCNRAIKFQPYLPEAYCKRGDVFMRLGSYRNAAADFSAAIRMQPRDPPAYLYLSGALEAMGLPEQAAAALRQAISIAPDFPDAHFNMGNLYHKAGAHEQAVVEFTQAIKFRENYADAYHNRAASLHSLGRDAEAKEDLQSCRKYGGTPNRQLESMIESALKGGNARPAPTSGPASTPAPAS